MSAQGRPFISMVRHITADSAIDFDSQYDEDDWKHRLVRDGYAVIKVFSDEKAAEYVDKVHEFLEGVNLGYDRNDPSTIVQEKLPIISDKGMIQAYGVSHEQFMWDIRQEPGVVDVFKQVWGTEDLICSFDALNVSFPNWCGQSTPWAHQDQDPDRPGFRCLQGLVNLLPNGPDDGGLIICKGSHRVSEKFHQHFSGEEREWAWTNEFYGYKPEGLQYLKDNGCEWVKVEAGPGELIVWDSRAAHYNCTPKGQQMRSCVYVSMMPASSATQDELVNKKKQFEEFVGTTHWPQGVQPLGLPCLRDGKPDPHNRKAPATKPQLSERGWKLTGIPYIRAGTV